MEFFDEDLDKETRPKSKKKKTVRVNHEMSVVVYFFVGLFLVMLGYFSWFVQIKAPDTINSSYNMRQQNLAKKVIRGKIFAANGDVLAEQAMNSENKEVRYYPYSEVFAHAVGYSTHGGTGVESGRLRRRVRRYGKRR